MSKDLNKRMDLIKRITKKEETSKIHLEVVPRSELVDEYIYSKTSDAVIKDFIYDTHERYNIDSDIVVTAEEITSLIGDIEANYDSEKLKAMIEDCEKSVMDSIVKPFGLASILFQDKVGGNVDTIHNVRNTDTKHNDGKPIYATDKNKKIYEERSKYNYYEYHDKNKNFKKHTDNIKKLRYNDMAIKDPYTGLELNDDDVVSIEHIISAKNIYNDPAVSLAGVNGYEIANSDDNLCYINGQLNSSIGERSPSEYLEDMKSLKNPEARQNMLNYLNSKSGPLTPEEKKAKKLIEQKNAIVENEESVIEQEKMARKNIDTKLSNRYYKSKEFLGDVGKTSAKEGMKMGLQQSIGILMREFSLATFDELKDVFSKRNDIKIDAEFIVELRVRLQKIADRVMLKKSEVTVAFKDGVISGFFSNLITVIINSFLTTSKRVVKMIREGFYSLLKAVKILFLHPESMTKEEAAHEATKLISSGLIISSGVALEETVQKSLAAIPVIGAFSDIIATVALGIVTGISMALVVYLIDKVDIFGVNRDELQKFISDELDGMISKDFEEFESNYEYIMNIIEV